MRQLKMIQDWGYDHLYLRQVGAITRVNLKDHTYRDVNKTPVEDFNSATTPDTELPSWMNAKTHLWMCGASQCGELQIETVCWIDQ